MASRSRISHPLAMQATRQIKLQINSDHPDFPGEIVLVADADGPKRLSVPMDLGAAEELAAALMNHITCKRSEVVIGARRRPQESSVKVMLEHDQGLDS